MPLFPHVVIPNGAHGSEGRGSPHIMLHTIDNAFQTGRLPVRGSRHAHLAIPVREGLSCGRFLSRNFSSGVPAAWTVVIADYSAEAH